MTAVSRKSAPIFSRLKGNIAQFVGRLDTPGFDTYKKLLVEGSIIDEYRFITGHAPAGDLWKDLFPSLRASPCKQCEGRP